MTVTCSLNSPRRETGIFSPAEPRVPCGTLIEYGQTLALVLPFMVCILLSLFFIIMTRTRHEIYPHKCALLTVQYCTDL